MPANDTEGAQTDSTHAIYFRFRYGSCLKELDSGQLNYFYQ